jgi:hypothetical protein
MTSHALGVQCGAIGFTVCPVGLWSCFGPTPPFSVPIPPCWKGPMQLYVIVCWERVTCFFNFNSSGARAKSLPGVLEETLDLNFCTMLELLTLGTPGDGPNALCTVRWT